MKKLNVKTIVMLMVLSVMFLNGYGATYIWTWTGLSTPSTTSWLDPGNWSGGNPSYNYPGENPSDTNDVIFDGSANYNCTIDISPISIHSLTIYSSFALLFSIPSDLYLSGDIYIEDNGGFGSPWSNSGNIILNGTSPQSIEIQSPSSWTFYDLTINKAVADTVFLKNNITVTDTLFNRHGTPIISSPLAAGYSVTANALPIELLSFTAVANSSTITLYWSTASEENNDYFIIERSSDCRYWEDIIHLPGAGNSLIILDYSWVDTDPSFGTNYYRLTQVDYDGKSESFGPLSVNFSGTQPALIYPNPAQDFITLPDRATIIDQQGRVILLGVPGKNDISNLPTGLYFVQIHGSTQSFIKQ